MIIKRGIVLLLVIMMSQGADSKVTPPSSSTTPTTKSSVGSVGTGKQSSGINPSTHTPVNITAATTKSPQHCIKGQCVAAGDDESCLGKVTGTCPFIGSCTKTINKNQTHSVFRLDCGQATCPNLASTTTKKPATPAAATTTTTTSTCCTDALCNKFQPKSAGVRLCTNVLYLGGILLLVALM